MANGIILKDGRLINVDFIALVTSPNVAGNIASFTIDLSGVKTIEVRGTKDDVLRQYFEIRRVMGISDQNTQG